MSNTIKLTNAPLQGIKAENGKNLVVSTDDHDMLINKDLPNQHPISAITGLQDELDSLNNTPIASVDNVGGIKLYYGSVNGQKVNRSGLVVDPTTGVTYVSTKNNGGIARSGDGQLHIVAATENEVETGTDIYKPIVPATLKKVVDTLQTALNDKVDISDFENWTGASNVGLSNIDSRNNGLYQFYGFPSYSYPYEVDGVLLQVDVEGFIHQVLFRQDCTIAMRVKIDGTWSNWKDVAENGGSGVYVGAGDMPEGYNVQIDPSGTTEDYATVEYVDNAITVTLNAEV